MAEIASLANVSTKYIDVILRENGVERRKRGSWKRKYTLNEDYFKTWSNNMAYILGFVAADGCINKSAQSIIISQKEPSILEAIREELGSNQPLHKNERTGVYLLQLNSKEMKNDLIKLHGITPNKSSILKFPNIPNQYLNHFVRGYFDGDGFVNYEKFFVSFVGGSLDFMRTLRKKLQEIGFDTNFTSHSTYYRVYISGRKTVKLFSDWLYKDKGLYLNRKYLSLQQEKLDADMLQDSKNKITTKKNNLVKFYITTNNLTDALSRANVKIEEYQNWIKHDPDFRMIFHK